MLSLIALSVPTSALASPVFHQQCIFVSDATTQQGGHDSVPVTLPLNQYWTATIADAAWIWGEDIFDIAKFDPSVNKTETFTKTFTVTGSSTASLNIAADNLYTARINGTVVDQHTEDPYLASNFETTHTTVIPAGLIHPGTNTLEIEVTNIGVATDARYNPAGLLYKLIVAADTCAVVPPVPPGPQPGHLVLTKHVVNDGGGVAAPSDFQLHVMTTDESPLDVANSPHAGSDTGITYELAPGDYTVSEDPGAHYQTTYSDFCAGGHVHITAGGNTECLVTNTFVPPPSCTVVSDPSTQEAGHDSAVLTFIHASWTHLLDSMGAKWIWGEDGVVDPVGNTTEVFTKVVHVNGTPSSATVDFATDNGYQVRVNGVLVGTDQIASEFNYGATTTLNILPNLTPNADNTIEFTVHNLAMTGGTQQTNPAGLIYAIHINDSTCSIPDPHQSATIVATKIVCDSDTDLPNLAGNSHATDANTASAFLASHPSCHLQSGWQFEWGNQDAGDAGNALIGPAGNGYTTSAQTDGTGSVTMTVPLANVNSIHIREVLKSGFIPFTFDSASSTPNGNSVSAELSCHQDGLNYDNLDYINSPTAGNTYYCVAYNAPKPSEGPGPGKFKVHIFKYLDNGDGGVAQIPNDSNAPHFPMIATYSIFGVGINLFPGDGYVLGDGGGVGGSDGGLQFAANTIPLSLGDTYGTHEVTGGDSVVVANADSCTPGKYLLEGYKTGDTLSDAQSATISSSAPNYLGIMHDKYVIVVNKACPAGQGGGDTTHTDETIVVHAGDLDTTSSNPLLVIVAGLNKWFFYNDTNDTVDNTLGSFVTGPATAPLGTGSAQMTDADANARPDIATYQFSGTKLADITSLAFSAYSHSGVAGASESPYLVMNVDFTGVSGAYQRRLVYVPSDNGSVPQDAWNTNDAVNGGAAKWVYSGPNWPATLVGPDAGLTVPGTTTRTWSAILADYPNARLLPSGGFVGVRVGEPGPAAYTGNVDRFVIGVKTGTNIDTKTYDFEPTAITPKTVINGGGGGGGGGGFITRAGSVLGASTSTPDVCSPLLTSFLKLGWKNDPTQVKKLQLFLASHLGITLPATGVFGPATLNAVKLFQKGQWDSVLKPWFGQPGSGISSADTPTGFVYQTTKWRINNIWCPGSEAFPTTLQ
ncbi:MAG: hypothetical protein JWO84_486 [Parcubacteria group bacterium]|nr:hypothetical protein [Parcubacteria group bacterium]